MQRRALIPLILASCFGEAPSVDPQATGSSSTSSSATGTTTSNESNVDPPTSDVTTDDPTVADTTSNTTSVTTGPTCENPGEPPEGWSPWRVVLQGNPEKPPVLCPGDQLPLEVLLLTEEPIACACDCGSHMGECNITAHTSTSGCGVSVTEQELDEPACEQFVTPISHIDVSVQAPGGNCDGPPAPAPAPGTVPASVCELGDDPKCEGDARICTMSEDPDCPEGTTFLETGRAVTCPECACTMAEWCSSARVDLFANDGCDAPLEPPFIEAASGCTPVPAAASMRAGDTRLGCFGDTVTDAPRTICCL